MKGLVIAGNYEQFRFRCSRSGVRCSDYKYLHSTDNIRGTADTTLYLVEEYWKHYDFIDNESRLFDYCSSHNIKVSKDFPN